MAPSVNMLRQVDPILSDYSVSYSQDVEDLVAPLLFPDKQVGGETGTYYIYDANQRFRHYPTYRADGAEAVSIKWRVTSATFALDEYAAKTDVTERQRNNELNPIELDQDAASIVSDAIMLDKELRARALIIPATPVFDTTITTKWDQSTATVMTDNNTLKKNFRKINGVNPNLLIINNIGWNHIVDDTGSGSEIGSIVREKFKFTMQTTSKNLNVDLIAELFGIDKVVVPDMIYSDAVLTSTIRGTSGIENGEFIWDKDADGDDFQGIIYAYVNPSGGKRSLTLGWNYWTEQLTTRRFPEPSKRKEWIENGVIEQQKITAASCLYRVEVWTP